MSLHTLKGPKMDSWNNRSSSADHISVLKRSQTTDECHNKPVSPQVTCRHELRSAGGLSSPLREFSNDNNVLLCENIDEVCHPSNPVVQNKTVIVSKCESYEFVKPSKIFSIIHKLNEDNDEFRLNNILLDTRENRLYQIAHIKHSYNVSCHTKTMTKRSIAFWSSWHTRSQQSGKNVFLYDQKTCENQGILNSHLQFFINYLHQQGNKVHIVDGGWLKFKEELGDQMDYIESSIERDLMDRYTFSPTNKDSASEDVLNAAATEINDYIWLGNERDAHDWDLLRRYGITHVLNVTNDVPNYFEHKRCMTYHRLPAGDTHSQDLIKFFNDAYEFIESAKNESGRVLVHCWAGVSRSATIVVAYFMRNMKLDAPCALDLVRRRRRVVAPNLNFMGQLERFYNTILKPSFVEQERKSGEKSSEEKLPTNSQLHVVPGPNVLPTTSAATTGNGVEGEKSPAVAKETPRKTRRCPGPLRKLSIPCSAPPPCFESTNRSHAKFNAVRTCQFTYPDTDELEIQGEKNSELRQPILCENE